MAPPQLSLEFHVFLVNQQTQKHTQESRTLRFWFRDGVGEYDQPRCAQSFFTDLVNPADFPRGKKIYIFDDGLSLKLDKF
jgi:hypothetical protein